MTTHRTRFAASVALALCAFTTSVMGGQWKITIGETTVALNERAAVTEDVWLEPTGEAARVFRTADNLHQASFLIDAESDFVVTIDDDGGIHYQGTIGHQGGLALGGRRNHQRLSTLTIGVQQTNSGTQFAVLDLRRGSARALILEGAQIRIDPVAGTLFIASSDLRLSPSWAEALNQPSLSEDAIGSIIIRAALQRVGGDDLESATPLSTESDLPGVTTAGTIGPDVIVGVLHQTASYGRTGGISAFSIGTISCNAGDEELLWIAGGTLHPVIPQNMFRLKGDRFEQIGQSWLKHGFFALQGNACGFGCTDSGTGARLGVGCSDPYGASLNGQQSNLGPKSDVNAFTGSFIRTTGSCSGCDVIDRRLQIHDVDLDPTLNAGALYFGESQYVAPDDAMAGNGVNNASYRRMLVGLDNGMNDASNPCLGVSNIGQGEYCIKLSGQFLTQRLKPGIRAWKDHDPEVMETEIRVPGEGLFILAAKAIDLGNDNWEYEYALQNINSNRSCGSFSLPLPIGTIVGETDFHDVDYHSRDTGGINYDGTDWPATVTTSSISWSTDQHATSPNANALRWSTLYNFRFVANAAPGETEVTLGLFRPGDPASVTGTTIGPFIPLADCDDGLWCNGLEFRVDGVCQPGTPVDCSDPLACTVDSCDEENDICVNTVDDSFCDNALFCDGAETCDPITDCQPGTFACPGQACNENLNTCVDCFTNVDCEDGKPCNGSEVCQPDGTCVHVLAADCNLNDVEDVCDISEGTSSDCQPNAVPDDCDVAGPTSDDINADGIPDECCEALNAPLAAPNTVKTNRYLQFAVNNPGQTSALRLTFLQLPAPYDIFNGASLWVGLPQEVSELSASVNPDDAPAESTFRTATLQCSPEYIDWSQYESVSVYHELIVPDGLYALQAVDEFCDELSEANYSSPLSLTTSRWGDLVQDCQTTPCGPPDGSVDIISDAVAVLRKFSNLLGAPLKVRADLEPALPDQLINITDVLGVIGGFVGGSYPFDPPLWPCN